MLARRKRYEGQRRFARLVIDLSIRQLKTAILSHLDEAVAASIEESRSRMPDHSGTLLAVQLPKPCGAAAAAPSTLPVETTNEGHEEPERSIDARTERPV